jgi:hypothetical protein
MNELEIQIKRANNCISKLRHLRDTSTNGDIIHTVNGTLAWFTSTLDLVKTYKGKYYGSMTGIKYDVDFLEKKIEKVESILEDIARRY